MASRRSFDHTANYDLVKVGGVTIGGLDASGQAKWASEELVAQVGLDNARRIVQAQKPALVSRVGRVAPPVGTWSPVVTVLEGNIRILGVTPDDEIRGAYYDPIAHALRGYGQDIIEDTAAEGSGTQSLTFSVPEGRCCEAGGIVLDIAQQADESVTRNGSCRIGFASKSKNDQNVRDHYVTDGAGSETFASDATLDYVTVRFAMPYGAARIHVKLIARPSTDTAVLHAVPETALLRTPVNTASKSEVAARTLTVETTSADGGQLTTTGWLFLPGSLEFDSIVARIR